MEQENVWFLYFLWLGEVVWLRITSSCCWTWTIMVYKVKFSEWFKFYLCTGNSELNLHHQKHNSPPPSCDIVKCGVPQGSVLGSFPLDIYVNDLPSQISWIAGVIMLADDTRILDGCLTVYIPQEIKWNAKLMQLGNFIDVFLAWRVSGTYAHHQEHQMFSCSIWIYAPRFWKDGGVEIRCVGRVYGADGAVHDRKHVLRIGSQHHHPSKISVHKSICCN